MSLPESGRAFYERAVQFLADLGEAEQEASSAAVVPRGTIRLTTSVNFGVRHVAPAIAEFMARHPEVRFDVSLSDRVVDLVEEGLDLAIRIGPPGPDNLVARKLGETRLVPCASPQYLARHGAPKTLDIAVQYSPFDMLAYPYDPSPGEGNKVQVLHDPAQPVAAVTPEITRLVDDMIETMYAAPGVGLAAPQIGVSLRMFVVDISVGRDPDGLMVFINPEFVERDGMQLEEEGCLSVPGFNATVVRPSSAAGWHDPTVFPHPSARSRARRITAIATSVLLAASLTACTSTGKTAPPAPTTESHPPSGPVPAGLERFYGQSLSWADCAPYATSEDSRSAFQAKDVQCARLTVPLDYAKPAGDTITLGLLRHKATDPGSRIGSLVVNPGGPGTFESLNLAIGQGANSQTVLSMARFYAALATDGSEPDSLRGSHRSRRAAVDRRGDGGSVGKQGDLVVESSVFRPDDHACCPSGSRVEVYRWSDGRMMRLSATEQP